MLSKEEKPGKDMTNSAEPHSSKPPATGTVLGTWPRRRKGDQGEANGAKAALPLSITALPDLSPDPWIHVKELQSQPSPLICSALATLECHECAAEGKLFLVSSGITWCSWWCLMWSYHWLKLAVPLDHRQPGTFVSSDSTARVVSLLWLLRALAWVAPFGHFTSPSHT